HTSFSLLLFLRFHQTALLPLDGEPLAVARICRFQRQPRRRAGRCIARRAGALFPEEERSHFGRDAIRHAGGGGACTVLARTAGESKDPIAKFLKDSEHFFFRPVYRAMIKIMIAARSDRACARILNPVVLDACKRSRASGSTRLVPPRPAARLRSCQGGKHHFPFVARGACVACSGIRPSLWLFHNLVGKEILHRLRPSR